jgi:hypothetical protein
MGCNIITSVLSCKKYIVLKENLKAFVTLLG